MGTIELKANIHKIVDGLEDEKLLRTIYDFLKVRESAKPGILWNSLTEDQKRELLLAFDESDDDGNLIDRNKVFKRR